MKTLKETTIKLGSDNNFLKRVKLISLLGIFLVVIINHLFIKNGLIDFIMSITVMGIIVLKSKFSILSLISVLANYPLIAITFQNFTGSSYGILELSVKEFGLHYYEINLATIIFNIIMLIYLFFTKINKYEKLTLNNTYQISDYLINIFCLIAIFATIVYLPRFSLLSGVSHESRYYHLLPGNAWNYVAIVSILFTTLSRKLSFFQIITYSFVILWFFMNYERVDMLGLTVLLVFRYRDYILQSSFVKYIPYKKIVFSTLFTSLFAFLFASSYLREGKSFNLFSLIRDILVQTTSCDIMHVFNTAFEYVENVGLTYGSTYLNYLYKIIPGFGNHMDYSSILDNYIANPGGGYFLSEPYMNFGYIGVLLFSILLLTVIYLLCKYSNSYTYLLYTCLVAASFRIMWYGLIYIHKSYIMIIPGLFIFMIFFDKKVVPIISNKKYKRLEKEN